MSHSGNQTWQRIRAEIIHRISERIWKPGELVPKEVDLAAEFGCSRSTINRAMQELADAGLLERKRKVGTRVALNPVRKATLDIPVVRLDVEGRGAVYHHEMLDRHVMAVPDQITGPLGLDQGAKLLRLRALHFADRQPFAFEDRWVNHIAFPAILDVDFETINANEWLVQNAPLTSGDIAFSAIGASDLEAEMLRTKTGAALFTVTRLTWVGSLPVTQVQLSYAPGFRMHTRL